MHLCHCVLQIWCTYRWSRNIYRVCEHTNEHWYPRPHPLQRIWPWSHVNKHWPHSVNSLINLILKSHLYSKHITGIEYTKLWWEVSASGDYILSWLREPSSFKEGCLYSSDERLRHAYGKVRAVWEHLAVRKDSQLSLVAEVPERQLSWE